MSNIDKLGEMGRRIRYIEEEVIEYHEDEDIYV